MIQVMQMYLKNGRTCCGMKSQKNNMWMKILSVVIAVLIWLFVANTNDPVITKRFYSICLLYTSERQTGILSKKLKKLFLFLLSEMVIFLPEKMLSECGNIQVVTELWLPEEQKEIHGSFER